MAATAVYPQREWPGQSACILRTQAQTSNDWSFWCIFIQRQFLYKTLRMWVRIFFFHSLFQLLQLPVLVGNPA